AYAPPPRAPRVPYTTLFRSRDVRVPGLGQLQQVREVGLSGRGAEQVVGAHHLVDTGGGIVDHHGEVVRHHPVPTAQHQVVDRGGDLARPEVVHLPGVH